MIHKISTFALFVALACVVSAAPQQKRGLLDGLPLVGGVLGNSGLLGGVLGGGSNGGLLGNNLLGGLLGGKGVAVAAAYSSTTYVHANVAANIAIDLPSQSGLLAPVTGLLGGVLPLSSLLGNCFATTTALTVMSDVDFELSVGVQASLDVSLPAGCSPVSTQGVVYASTQVGIKIDVSAHASVAATLVTPVLNFDASQGTLGLLKLDNTGVFSRIPCVFDATTGRLAADLGVGAIAGTYIFVNIQVSV